MTSKKPILFIAILLMIAGLLDLKYKGKFYQLLPTSIQSYVNKF
ncbi:hypothetical protein SPD48_04905 [Pseudogracilibacillus sp. SE30717A]